MTCFHRRDDPNCSSSPEGAARIRHEQLERQEKEFKKREAELLSRTPEPDKYQIIQAEQVGAHLVMCVKYISCQKCVYEGNKIMVFLNTSPLDALKWNRIDPHFRDPNNGISSEAPSPAARFPGCTTGWDDAIAYAKSKQ